MIDDPVAEIFIEGQGGTFVCESIDITTTHVRARGRWRRRWGAESSPQVTWGELVERAWPWRRIHEVRHVPEQSANARAA